MSDTDTYTVSFKSSEAYDAALVVVRGNSAEELERNLDDIRGDLLVKVVEVGAELSIAARLNTPEKPNPGAVVAAAQQQTQETHQQGAPVEAIRTCDHGKRTRREGTSGRGPWVGHFCPLRKGDPNQCKPIFEDN